MILLRPDCVILITPSHMLRNIGVFAFGGPETWLSEVDLRLTTRSYTPSDMFQIGSSNPVDFFLQNYLLSSRAGTANSPLSASLLLAQKLVPQR